MIERLNIIEDRYHELEKELVNPDVLNDYNKMKSLSKEKSSLEETVNKYHEYKHVMENIEGLKELTHDPEMGEMAQLELDEENQK